MADLNTAAAEAGRGDGEDGALLSSDSLNTMTIAQMRDWLTHRDATEAVWALNNRCVHVYQVTTCTVKSHLSLAC